MAATEPGTETAAHQATGDPTNGDRHAPATDRAGATTDQMNGDHGGTATTTEPTGEAADGVEAERGFSRSIVISGIRCTLTYVILPFVAPWIGLAPGVGPTIGLAVGTVAIAANLFSIRRFWRSDHRWKVPATALHGAVLILLTILMVLDIRQLVG